MGLVGRPEGTAEATRGSEAMLEARQKKTPEEGGMTLFGSDWILGRSSE